MLTMLAFGNNPKFYFIFALIANLNYFLKVKRFENVDV